MHYRHNYKLVGQQLSNTANSVSQYEAQFKKWNSPKNLTHHDWRFILPRLDDLHSRHFKTRVKLSGQVVSEGRIKRARRYIESKAFTQTQPPALQQGMLIIKYSDDELL